MGFGLQALAKAPGSRATASRRRHAMKKSTGLILSIVSALLGGVALSAQFQMPDPRQMSGIPRPVDDLPAGTVSVRLIRGALSNNIKGHPVELRVGDKVQTANTDENGRAEFRSLPPGATLKAAAVVDGERLESQEFPAPSQGGIRLMLVATDKEKERQKAEEASAPAMTGQVVLGGESRIVIQPSDESIQIYYLLEISNTARAPVNTAAPFVFDMPTGAVGTAVLEGSSPQVSVTGTRVRVAGPFPPGQTVVRVGTDLPASSGALEISQKFPATLEQLTVIARKTGDLKLSSPQIDRQQDVPTQGVTVIAATGGTVPAGQAVTLKLSGLPHHSTAPRWITLSLAGFIVIAGVWAASRTEEASATASERKRLIARREKLFQDLVRLEQDRRRGRVDQTRYGVRREELVAGLEHVLGALDSDDAGPEPTDRAGVAA